MDQASCWEQKIRTSTILLQRQASYRLDQLPWWTGPVRNHTALTDSTDFAIPPKPPDDPMESVTSVLYLRCHPWTRTTIPPPAGSDVLCQLN